jgi:DNA ligase-1
MQAFADLLDRLTFTPSRQARVRIIRDYLASTPDPDRGWALAAITGEIRLPGLRPGLIRTLAASRLDPVLFALSYDYVGDLAETVSLLWPARPGANREPRLSEAVEGLTGASPSERPALLERWLDALSVSGRYALIKLATGRLRIGASRRLALQAAADFGGRPVGDLEEVWHGLAPPYEDLFAWLENRSPRPGEDRPALFRPVMLAHPAGPALETGGALAGTFGPDSYAAEWKWDGVRIQMVRQAGVQRLYTRTGEDVSEAFPDLMEETGLEGRIDGELLIRSADGEPAPFSEVQKRLTRRKVSAREAARRPAFIRAYDILDHEGRDLRPLTFRERRARLEHVIAGVRSDRIDLSALLEFTDRADLERLRAAPPLSSIEGLMLKRWDSPYTAGRPQGLWYKWKRDPFLVDAVLMYAQRGHGRRSGSFSDFTFGVWVDGPDGERLTPVGKAYFGFTDEELVRLDRFVRENTIERFGPVQSLRTGRNEGLVLEIAFDALQRSGRHRSGVAMRFPRVNRIRWDKPAGDADTLAALIRLIPESPSEGSV